MNTGATAPQAINRRQFLRTATAITVVAGSVPESLHAAQKAGISEPTELIDTNVSLGRWPFRRLPLDETSALVAKLRKYGVTQAWAGSFDSLLHKDLAASNARLVDECRRHGRGLLLPFGSVNPGLAGWEKDFRLCVAQHEMRGLRLNPNYHGYELNVSALAKLLSLASERRLIVEIAVSMEDERMQSPLVRIPHVDLAPLAALLQQTPELAVVLLNWQRAMNGELLKKLAASGEVYFDIATVEGVGGVAKLIREVPPERVLFGSLAPLFYFESSSLKLRESALEKESDEAIRVGNARRLLARE